ncbi:hypothetical protein MQX03_11460 [Chryseobacterium aahli]|uniref:hypothetical protein n=1 Tax=Chryseobacterium aahli TaxID=1278643 RepID=UPI001F61C051|nr:hypothetical protein [Chryseobacterium aahli]MCI3937822.1 hypothetical protein [Chryseobacterium aahli]
MIFDNCFRLLETKTFSQKNKSELLYEAMFTYEKDGLQSVKYIRHKPTKFREGNYIENLTFEYNENGMLETFNDKFRTKTKWIYDQIGNPTSIKMFDNYGICVLEKRYHYEYDKYNNWIFKVEKIFIKNDLRNEKQISREIEYY